MTLISFFLVTNAVENPPIHFFYVPVSFWMKHLLQFSFSFQNQVLCPAVAEL